MNNIYVEANKKIESGFILTESDARRILQVAIDQCQKVTENDVFQKFFIKFENGAVLATSDINEVFNEENSGSTQIVRLRILIATDPIEDDDEMKNDNNNNPRIYILFNDSSSNNNNMPGGMRYGVIGNSRDWVMVTSSLIEERLAKVKRKLYKLKYDIFFMLMVVVMGALISFDNKIFLPQSAYISLKDITEIENNYKSGKINDIGNLILTLEKKKALAPNNDFEKYVFLSFLLGLFMFLLISSNIINFQKFYPYYNFCWGDYSLIFSKIEKRRKFVFGVIVFTIILGIAINLLSTFIWNKVR